jgi:circadian clock protein KaiB
MAGSGDGSNAILQFETLEERRTISRQRDSGNGRLNGALANFRATAWCCFLPEIDFREWMPPGEGACMDKYVIKLYVTGQTPRSQRAIDNLRRICDEELHGKYNLAVIDVLERPQLAEDEKILATPTVVKELPPPIRRIIGDLSDTERVLLGLDLHPTTTSL